ncbi:TolC family protein [Thauera sp. SWB20]|uniref:TolC family protein n=1 Tax=Thauera sp. SWB20 TaxID=1572758 RepID=UPI0005ADECF3|nr:TolC family protein [Thauera sp. SWB20]KIN89123.1 outer membrane efflux family protein [Thauera sp. SWB20]
MKSPFAVPSSHQPRLAALALVLALTLGSGSAWTQGVPDTPTLGASPEALIEYARQSNPGFAAARAEASAAQERVTPAGALPDPTFEVELMDATNTMSGRPASLLPGQVGETRYRITQPLPGWGKRELAVKAAEAQVTQADAMRDAAWTELAAKIEALWLRYYVTDREHGLNREALTLLQGLEELSLARYELGLLPQQAVLRMQREITTQRLALVEVEQRRKGLAAGLNGLLGRAHDAPLVPPADPAPLPDGLTPGALFEAAASGNPEVRVAANGIDVARAERARTYQDRLPDFAVGVRNNRPDEGKASWDVMFEVMIPLQQSSRRAREREAEYMLMAAEARREDAKARASGELGTAWSMYAQGRETLHLLEHTLLPQAQATRDASQAALSSGKVDFDSVIEAERQLIDIRMRQLQTELEARLALTEIKKLTGELK